MKFVTQFRMILKSRLKLIFMNRLRSVLNKFKKNYWRIYLITLRMR
jgi:hypothetical protein